MSTKMNPKLTRVPSETVVVFRDNGNGNERTIPEIGKPFEFTEDEIKQIDKMSPGVLGTKAEIDVTETPNATAQQVITGNAAAAKANATPAGPATSVKPAASVNSKDGGL